MAKGSSSAKKRAAVFLPGAEHWELWRANGGGGYECVETTDDASLVPEKVPGGVGFAYPVASAIAVPFWASTDDPAMLQEVGDVHLERLGVNPAAALGKLREFQVVDRVGNQSLAVATVLAPPPGKGFSKHPPERFEVSPNLYRLPNDAVTVWRELGRLVIAVTRNDTPVYFHALSAREMDAAAVQEIRCVLLQLGTQDAIPGVDEMVLWLGEDRDERLTKLIKEELGIPLRFEGPPRPALPEEPSTLVPEEVATIRHRQEQRRLWRGRMVLAGLIYLLVIGFVAGRLVLTRMEAGELRVEIARNQPEVDAMRATKARWEALRLAIDADAYPIETLLKCVSQLPPRGVRLTEFEVTGNEIYLKGEASSAPEAIKFKGVLTSDPKLADYEWNFPPPVIVPNKGATFQTRGKLKYAIAEEK